MYALQNFLYGPLRPAEVEQLWERGWFAVMEWIFAMSTFRDEFGIWFLTMFLSLFTGKVWGWIAEGRVEQLDQQDPGRVSLFHPKLVASLIIYLGFAVEMFLYSLDIVMFEARPGMTVMFVFEFAILWICAVSTCLRYCIWVYEHWIWQKQKKVAVEARKAEIRRMRQEAAAANLNDESASDVSNLPNENNIDEEEIEVAGWESKKGWLFALDIVTGMSSLPTLWPIYSHL
jgi:E3 ubiquitin-protein ligase synoviolin